MKYSEMTKEQIKEAIDGRQRFTTDELSIQEAIELFKVDKVGAMYKSYILLEDIVPAEYLDNKEFMQGIIPTRVPFTYDSVFAHASTRLKNDKELAKEAIIEHGPAGVEALSQNIKLSDKEKLQQYKQDPNVYIEEIHNMDGDLLGYKARSILLKDDMFIHDVIREFRNQPEKFMSIKKAFLKESKTCSTDRGYVVRLLEKTQDLWGLESIDDKLFKDKVIVRLYMEKVVNGNYGYYKTLQSKLEVQKDSNLEKLLKTCSKIDELPRDAKLRKAILSKIADKHLERFKEEIRYR